MYKAAVFDFDFTLGDSAGGIIMSVNFALEDLGYGSRSGTEIRETIGLSLSDTFLRLTGCESPERAKQFERLFVQKADEVMTDNSTLYSGVIEGLRRIRSAKIKTAVVTTKFHYRIEQILSKFNALDLVDTIIGGEDVKHQKPDPEGLLLAAERLGLAVSDILYVGDSIVDAGAAQAAGMDFAAVLTGTARDFSKYPSVAVKEDISGIFDYLIKL